MSRIRVIGGWLVKRIKPRRIQLYGVALGVGCVIGAVIYVGKQEAQHNRADNRRQDQTDQRLRSLISQNSDLLARLRRLEHPTRADIRREIERFLHQISPAQLRRLSAAARASSPTGAGGPLEGPPSTRPEAAGPPASSSPPSSSTPTRPSTPTTPRPPAVPTPERPVPPPPRPGGGLVPELPSLPPAVCRIVPLPALCP